MQDINQILKNKEEIDLDEGFANAKSKRDQIDKPVSDLILYEMLHHVLDDHKSERDFLV